MLNSCLCTQAQLESPAFQAWAGRLGKPAVMNRKIWEFAYIAQALDERDMLRAGRRGLGFGVGLEPLPALFAGMGCEITATDQTVEAAARDGWDRTGQHAASLAALADQRGDWCTEDDFYKRVSFRNADMRCPPDDLGTYDFIWSACSLEHLGTLAAGVKFVLDSLRFVAPGGLAVHTTEYNVKSNDGTLAQGGVTLYRRRDLEQLALQLGRAGYGIELDFTEGDLDADRFVDRPPYRGTHLRLDVGGYVATSFGLIIGKAGR